jgi:3-hydroxyisobutyrate dehydrogenase-like beta-hydroxyacid dehydrogenase
MSDVSVIGTGAMGSALVERLQARGNDVAVWNRTRWRAEQLAGPTVHLVDSVPDALMSSPLTIVSVTDHEVAHVLVKDASVDLMGRVVASTCFVTPDQAELLTALVDAAGGSYLDLEIAASPRQVRSGTGVFLISGEHAAFDKHREMFERLGRVAYVDATAGSAYLAGMALELAYLPMAVGLLQGARIAQSLGFAPEQFKRTVLDWYPTQIEHLLEGVTAHDSEGFGVDAVEASVDAMVTWSAEYGAALREMAIDPGMYDALHQLFSAASAAGDGESDWTCIAQHVATR